MRIRASSRILAAFGLLIFGGRASPGADEARRTIREELLEETEQAWEPVLPIAEAPGSTLTNPVGSDLRNQLNAVILPEVRFDGVELGVAPEALAGRDAASGGRLRADLAGGR